MDEVPETSLGIWACSADGHSSGLVRETGQFGTRDSGCLAPDTRDCETHNLASKLLDTGPPDHQNLTGRVLGTGQHKIHNSTCMLPDVGQYYPKDLARKMSGTQQSVNKNLASIPPDTGHSDRQEACRLNAAGSRQPLGAPTPDACFEQSASNRHTSKTDQSDPPLCPTLGLDTDGHPTLPGTTSEDLPITRTIVTTDTTNLRVSPVPRFGLTSLTDFQTGFRFTKAVGKQNQVATAAIQSLDCLNDQIVQYIVSSQSSPLKDGLCISDQSVHSSMVLIRKLLLDAQARFRKMVENNKQLASHIDLSIQAANREVSILRADLVSTNQKLSQLSRLEGAKGVDRAVQVDKWDKLMDRCCQTAAIKGMDQPEEHYLQLEAAFEDMSESKDQLRQECQRLSQEHQELKLGLDKSEVTNENLGADNVKLEQELWACQRQYDELRQAQTAGLGKEPQPTNDELKLELIQIRQEVQRAKELVQGLKCERKRLKGEKLDLLSQMKQLYIALEDKEVELRDFIHNYDQRVKESDEMVKQIAREKEEVEKEKWEMLTRAKEAIDRAVHFKTLLDDREQTIRSLEVELSKVKEQLEQKSSSILMTSSVKSGCNSDINDNQDVFPSIEDTSFSTMEESSVLNSTFSHELETKGHIISSSPTSQTEFVEAPGAIFKWFTHSSDLDLTLESRTSKRKKKGLGTLSHVFSRGRVRHSVALPHVESLLSDGTSHRLCVLSEDNYQEKLDTIEKMVGVPMKDWRAHQVLAWLEITLAMPMYALNCLTNVKSGRVLLGLSDNELSSALGVTNVMHRRKLRIAIEQHRNPNDIKFLKASEMDPTWIGHSLLPDLGLSQYTEIFEEQLCDGHVLNTLTRRDLEKYFSVHRKFHQSSILHAIDLLRRIDFNKDKLYQRRNLSEEKDIDLIVWTNGRILKWLRSIDLGEYSENLLESGVHGALMVLDPSFSADTLASIMGIPPVKSYIKRHLTTELDKILKPARVALDSDAKVKDKSGGRKSSQDQGQKTPVDKDRRMSHEEGRSRLSFRSSFGRAFGKKIRDEVKLNESEASKMSISAPIPMQHSSLSSLNSESELARKGFCFNNSERNVSNSGLAGYTTLCNLLSQHHKQTRINQHLGWNTSDLSLDRSQELHSISEDKSAHLEEKTDSSSVCSFKSADMTDISSRHEGSLAENSSRLDGSQADNSSRLESSLTDNCHTHLVPAAAYHLSLTPSSSVATLTEHFATQENNSNSSKVNGDALISKQTNVSPYLTCIESMNSVSYMGNTSVLTNGFESDLINEHLEKVALVQKPNTSQVDSEHNCEKELALNISAALSEFYCRQKSEVRNRDSLKLLPQTTSV